ncbi:hotdog fold thioesterase [Georgenia sp. EYE_87]|uniref:PaaI family thioesterase n=1 Tax=Georgenia sp. EYE_87 TaxID=2853448 RepID=UPI002005C3F7|nr:hotdog fold thioesterase [Georgenia sp. EYE_87]MCK6209024.1 hotdog fold thioesterase [Georgenia sp. EYE_87]
MTDTDDLVPALRATFPGTLIERLGIELLAAGPEHVVARMPVAGNTQPHGMLHGGATAALAETVGSFAATIHAGPGRVAVGTELSATHHRPAREGHVTATTTALHRGRRTATFDVAVVDDAGRRVCTARLSCMILDRDGAGPATPGP